MSGNYPDGVNQSDIDRAHDGGDEPEEEVHIGNTLEEDFDALEAQVEKSAALIDKLRDYNRRLKTEVMDLCPTCIKYKGQMCPSHFGSQFCESGSLESGGTKSHCTCDWCF
jgi:hypothetical protein